MYATKIINKLNTESKFYVPFWFMLYFLAEWIHNPHLDYRTFGSGALLLMATIQVDPEYKVTLYLNYALRLILFIAMVVVAHPNEFWAGLEKLGF